MASVSEIARRCVEQAVSEAGASGYKPHEVARAVVDAAVDTWQAEASPAEVADALSFVARNINDEEDHSFMRP